MLTRISNKDNKLNNLTCKTKQYVISMTVIHYKFLRKKVLYEENVTTELFLASKLFWVIGCQFFCNFYKYIC